MRPTLDETFMSIAQDLARRADCKLRQVGCVVVDDDNNIVATGYNGTPRSMDNCSASDVCQGGCNGVHAEVNALLRSNGRGARMFVTCAPCWHCMKTIVNSTVHEVIFEDISTMEPRTTRLAKAAGINLRWRKDNA